jgi:hypothetical protein
MSATGDTTELKPAGRYPEVVFRRPRSPFRRIYAAWNNAELFTPPPRSAWPDALKRLLWVGFGLMVLEFIGFCIWNQVQVNRFGLTSDFGNYIQAVHQLAHGVLNPQDTIQPNDFTAHPLPFWKNAVELFIVPLAVAYRIWPHIVVIKWMQNLALVATQALALFWMCELAAKRWRDGDAGRRWAVPVVALGVVVLIANPWYIWASSVDVHGEPFCALLVLAAARDLYSGRRRAWIWIVLALLSTGIASTYVAAIGIAAVASGRVRLVRGAAITVLSVAYLAFLTRAHLLIVGGAADTFSPIVTGGTVPEKVAVIRAAFAHATGARGLRGGAFVVAQVTYGELIKTVIEHPGNVIRAIWVNHNNLWAVISGSGLVGLLWLPALIPTAIVLLQGGFVPGFSLPGFQNIFAIELMAVGTVAVCLKYAPAVRSRYRWWFAGLLALLAINSVIWSAVWLARLTRQELDVTPAAAKVLSNLRSKIGPNDEVVSSQGFVGGFADRKWVYRFFDDPTTFDVQHGRKVWIILAPSQGIETADASSTIATIAELAHNPEMHLVVQKAGITAFEWMPPRGVTSYTLKAGPTPSAPAWTLAGTTADVVRHGSNKSKWYASSSGTPGYVISQAYWRALPGVYRANVSLSARASTNVEMWDTTRNVLLAREVLSGTNGIRHVRLTATLRKTVGQPTVNAWGIWKISPIFNPGDSLEVRVWTAGARGAVNVYRVAMTRLQSY